MIVDIMASRITNKQVIPKIPFDLISKISDESCMPICYGGGIRSISDLSLLFRAGIEKVCINTAAILNPQFIRESADEFGSQSIVASLDVKQCRDEHYEIYTNCGTNPTRINPVKCARMAEEAGAGEILLNSIERDGMMGGYDIELIKSVTSAVGVPVIALGGAGSMADFANALHNGGASAAAAGSMFVYFGRKKAVLMNYPSREEIDLILNEKN